MKARCQEVQERAAAFIDNEADARWASAIAAHLKICPQCARDVDQQRQMKTLVHQHAQRLNAPAPLRAKIRHLLAASPARYGFWEEIRHIFSWRPLPALATAAMLMLLPSVLTYYFSRPAPAAPHAELVTAEASVEGEVICIDCFLLDELHLKHGHDTSHRFGLHTTDGRILSIMAFEKGSELLLRAADTHRLRVRVHGRMMAEQRFFQVKEFSVL